MAGPVRVPGADSADIAAFKTAKNLLDDKFYEKAEAAFAQFAATFTNSPWMPDAILGQANARLEQTNYAGAIELLSARIGGAGTRADKYLLWLGEAYYRQGTNRLAAETFAKLSKDFPASTNRLEAVIREARAYKKMADWGRVVELLGATNGVFRTAIRTNAMAQPGYLLLSEAQLALTNYSAAEATLAPLRSAGLEPEMAWQWQYLLCRIQVAAGRVADALQSTSNLLFWAGSTRQPALQAESWAFRAGILERQDRFEEAITAYTNNLAPGLPAAARRQAFLKIIGLYLKQDKVPSAAEWLEQLLGQDPNFPAADVGWQTLGELRLRQHSTRTDTNAVYLVKAREAFAGLAKNFLQSPLWSKGQMYLGWCYWLEDKIPEAQRAFQSAAERLPPSPDQAFAYFKLADSQFKMKDFTNALSNYNAVIEKFPTLPEAQTNLIERALYQAVRSALAVTNLAAATNLVAKILAWYPNGFHTGPAVLLTGQEISRQGDPGGARKIFSAFAAAATNSTMLPEVQLAIARTYEEEGRWPEAVSLYEGWLGTFTNHPAQPQAEYSRALATFRAGDETNALRFFTNFVARVPPNELTPRAQWWVGDYYFHRGGLEDLILAEDTFQRLYLGSNHLDSELACQAQMMAGLAAKNRQGWTDAARYFTNLANKASCPMDLRLQARFAFADVLTQGTAPDFKMASLVFGSICDDYPTNWLAAAAWGRRAECLLQNGQFKEALSAFQQVTNLPNADPAFRAQAKVGQAMVLEKQAETLTGDEQAEKRKLALNLCLDVLYDESELRDGVRPNLLFWTQKAGDQAGRLAELMHDWRHARNIYERLRKILPVLSASLDKKILSAQEKLDTEQKAVP